MTTTTKEKVLEIMTTTTKEKVLEIMTTTTKEKVLEILEYCEFKTEHKNGVFSVWFHEGNGWNFKVSYHFRANKTKIVRYHTNGHVNTDDASIQLNGLHIATNWQEAEYLFYLFN